MTGGSTPKAPRIRDLPGPRDNPSLSGPFFQWVFKWPYRAALAGLYRLRLRAWQLTLLSLIANLIVGALLLTGRRLLPGGLLLAAGLLDIFDGGIARLRGEESRKGALLDAVVDRVSDGVVFGAIYIAEATVHHNRLTAGFALAGLAISLLVSHVRAEGEAAGLKVTEGSVQRLERYAGLVIGLMVPGALLPVLVGLTALGLVTTVQRLTSVWKGLPRASKD
ncbi:MAG: CDP-alcohol phosphatidyltransferase family protein [Actinomycetota bacterium]